jgi:hypothetical protein
VSSVDPTVQLQDLRLLETYVTLAWPECRFLGFSFLFLTLYTRVPSVLCRLLAETFGSPWQPCSSCETGT